MARKPATSDSQAVAARIILLGLAAWRGAIEQAHQHGVAEIWLPIAGKPTPIGDVLKLIHAQRDNARLKPYLNEGDRFYLRSKLGVWSSDNITDAISGLETATVLAWAVQLLDHFPSWTASMQGFTSIGGAVLSEGVVDRIWKDAALRDRATLEEHRRQAAAWRWRAWAEYYRRNMDDLAKTLRPLAKATIKRIPEIAAYCREQVWFKPDLDDFPVARLAYGHLSGGEVAALRSISQSRNWALQIALAGADPEATATDTDAEGCLRILFADPERARTTPVTASDQPPALSGFDWTKPQPNWQVPVRIPLTKGDHAGPHVLTRGMLISAVSLPAIEQNRFVIWPNWLDDKRVTWCEWSDNLLCGLGEDGQTFVAAEIASETARDELRVPRFIHGEEWPMCCGRSMQFVGQLDDETICCEPPPDAKYWWHDAASFYVFTCALCLECKAIGQQY